MMQTTQRNVPTTFLPFAALAVMWGTSFVAVEVGPEFFPTFSFVTLRYEFTGLMTLMCACYLTDRWWSKMRDELSAIAIDAVLITAAYHDLFYLEQGHVLSMAASITISLLSTLTTVFASAIFTRGPLGKTGTVGLLTGFAGTIPTADPILVFPGSLRSVQGLSIAFIFLAAVPFMLGMVLTRPLQSDLSVRPMRAWSMFGDGVLLHG